MTGGQKYISFEVESVRLSFKDVFSFPSNDFLLTCAASEKCQIMLYCRNTYLYFQKGVTVPLFWVVGFLLFVGGFQGFFYKVPVSQQDSSGICCVFRDKDSEAQIITHLC